MKLYIGPKLTALSSDIHQALSYVIWSKKSTGLERLFTLDFLTLLWGCDILESQTPNVFIISYTKNSNNLTRIKTWYILNTH
jgi:hypothetical protein